MIARVMAVPPSSPEGSNAANDQSLAKPGKLFD
jgi:hypothetical protein